MNYDHNDFLFVTTCICFIFEIFEIFRIVLSFFFLVFFFSFSFSAVLLSPPPPLPHPPSLTPRPRATGHCKVDVLHSEGSLPRSAHLTKTPLTKSRRLRPVLNKRSLARFDFFFPFFLASIAARLFGTFFLNKKLNCFLGGLPLDVSIYFLFVTM